MAENEYIVKVLAAAREIIARQESEQDLMVQETCDKYVVNRTDVYTARQIIDKGGQTFLTALLSSDIGFNAAFQLTKYPEPKRYQLLHKVIAEKQAGSAQAFYKVTGKSAQHGKPTQRLPQHRASSKPLEERMADCLSQLENASDLLRDFIKEPASKREQIKWLKRLRKIRAGLTVAVYACRYGGQNGTAKVREGTSRVPKAER